ncbi:MAG: phosphoenolpyruvate synthase [Dichotomicrobium sp.]
MPSGRYVRWFSALGLGDVPLVGGKNASIGELYRELTPLGVRVPNGFAITADAYFDMLSEAGASDGLHALLDDLDNSNVTALAERAAAAREIVYGAGLNETLRSEVVAAYAELRDEYGDDLSLAVRSSATAEDLPSASFAGQHDTYLNVKGDEMLLDACRRCFASLFTDRAISYRAERGFDHFKVALSIGVMKMVRADLAAAGVMFSLDTETGFKDVVFINAAYGLGENVVKGTIDPDEFYVHKPTYEQGYRAVLRRRLGDKQMKMVYATGHTREQTRNLPTPEADQQRFCITDADALDLAGQAIVIAKHYSTQAGEDRPMDIEWAKDGRDGQLYVVQARPETVASQRKAKVLKTYHIRERGPVLAKGRAVGNRIATGQVHVIPDAQHLADFKPGEVLVADSTTPDWEPVMKTAAALVTARGGRTCHAAIVARELGIPAVVGAANASETLAEAGEVTVSCAEGDVGRVYKGALAYETQETDLSGLERPATQIMINVGNPEAAFQLSFLPNDGVGLARMEFIINEYIKVHPMALLRPEEVEDKEARAQIGVLTRNYDRPADFFIERLSEGVGTIAAAFYPKPVIVRMSDFKTNEYAQLIGGRSFEPEEDNPMLGFRGAARYAHPDYAEGFGLECAAMKRVREQMGLTNVRLMIPFCRRVEEARRVLEAMAGQGLKRGENGLEIYVMCEIPNNVLLMEDFAALFDGFSIGSNDLTQLTLGVDRDSELVAFDFDERDSGILRLIRMAVEGAKASGRHIGICGQAPSDYPEFARFLVEIGIDSISFNADCVPQTMRNVLEVEKALGRDPRDA